MSDAQAALKRLCDPTAEVSAHYLVAADGRLWQLVDEVMRAWHAGAGSWQGRADVNSRSIGIELENPGTRPFPEPQMRRLESLLAGVLVRWRISPRGVIGHSDMAPERKHDPGPRFDWQRLARQGLALAPVVPLAHTPAPREPLDACLDAIGYPPAPAADRLAAFRARFRPVAHATGLPATSVDHDVAAAVVAAMVGGGA